MTEQELRNIKPGAILWYNSAIEEEYLIYEVLSIPTNTTITVRILYHTEFFNLLGVGHISHMHICECSRFNIVQE